MYCDAAHAIKMCVALHLDKHDFYATWMNNQQRFHWTRMFRVYGVWRARVECAVQMKFEGWEEEEGNKVRLLDERVLHIHEG